MTDKIASEIQAQQTHGRAKYGSGPDDLAHDDTLSQDEWASCIDHHNERALCGPAIKRREHLIKVAGLAVSAIEAIDRDQERSQ